MKLYNSKVRKSKWYRSNFDPSLKNYFVHLVNCIHYIQEIPGKQKQAYAFFLISFFEGFQDKHVTWYFVNYWVSKNSHPVQDTNIEHTQEERECNMQ